MTDSISYVLYRGKSESAVAACALKALQSVSTAFARSAEAAKVEAANINAALHAEREACGIRHKTRQHSLIMSLCNRIANGEIPRPVLDEILYGLANETGGTSVMVDAVRVLGTKANGGFPATPTTVALQDVIGYIRFADSRDLAIIQREVKQAMSPGPGSID